MSRLLALDQSSHVTGWAVFDQNKLITFGKIELNDNDIGKRLHKLRQSVSDLIKEHEINEVVLEDIQLQANVLNNVQTFKILAEVFGVIYELVTELEIPNAAILASTWKASLGIKGKNRSEQKRNAQEWVLEHYNVKAIQDICDAICIGACHSAISNIGKVKNKNNNFNWN